MCRVEDIVKSAVENEAPAVAITDHGNANCFGDLYKAAKENNIKPIYGCEFYFVPDLKKWKEDYEGYKEQKKKDKKQQLKLRKSSHLIILAKDKQGFMNMNRLIFNAYQNVYYRPRIDFALLRKYHKGLICMSACMAGEIPQLILDIKDKDRPGDKEEAGIKLKTTVKKFKKIFGGDFYLELQFNEIKQQHIVNKYLKKISDKYKVPLVSTVDSHYLNPGDNKIHQSLLLLQSKATYKNLQEDEEKGFKEGGKAWRFHAQELYYKNYHQLLGSYERLNYEKVIDRKTFEQSVDNTVAIADKIKDIPFTNSIKLKDMFPEIESKFDFLQKICFDNLAKKGLDKKEYKDRLKFELSVVYEKKIADYFLIVSKIVKDAKKKMFVGCGRGSAAGSLICYLLGITEVDPIVHGLYFERFLAVDREDYPDIDIDFEDNKIVKQDLVDKFPNEVACITAYNTFQLSGLLKDLCRVHSISTIPELNRLTKNIRIELELNEDDEDGEKASSVSYDYAYNLSTSFQNFVKKHKIIGRDMKVLLGQIRHIGKHAAGIIICDNLIERQPTMIVKDNLQTSLTEGVHKRTLPDFGYIKIDILGLKTLAVIHETLKYIAKKRKTTAKKLYRKIRIDKIDLEDKKVYRKVFLDLNLLGVFQFETSKIKQLIKEVKPTCFKDLAATNALFRPGPLRSGMAFEYGDRKRGKITPDYFNNKTIKKYLSPTYGIMIFQEQIMELGHFLGELTLGETNYLRKLLVKVLQGDEKNVKGRKELEGLKKKFVKGAVKKGVKKEVYEGIWKNMEHFAGYGFNKAHSVCYAGIAYQCAYLKTYFPVQFYTALLNNEKDVNYRRIIGEVTNNGIKVEPLDLNNSELGFIFKNKTIFWGFDKINGIGDKAARTIIESRNKKKITTLFEFISRKDVTWRLCNKRVVEILIKIGAFDNGKPIRNLILNTYKTYKDLRKICEVDLKTWKTLTEKDKWKMAIKYSEKKIGEKKDYSERQKVEVEVETYKVNLAFSLFKVGNREKLIAGMLKRKVGGSFEDGRKFVIALFHKIKELKDKNGNKMCFVDLVDVNGVLKDGLIFSSLYSTKKIKEGDVYVIQGKNDGKFIINMYKNVDSFEKT